MARTSTSADQAIAKLRLKGMPENLAGMARFGINTDQALGVSMPNIRLVGLQITKDHELALQLWRSGIHEARILACLVDEAKWVTPTTDGRLGA